MINSFLLQFIFLFLTIVAQAAVSGSFVDENGNEQVIETTDSHPFWIVTKLLQNLFEYVILWHWSGLDAALKTCSLFGKESDADYLPPP
jgi:hypothetical protein